MYDHIFSICNRLPFLSTTSHLPPRFYLHLVSCRMTEHLLHAIIEECNRQLGNTCKGVSFQW